MATALLTFGCEMKAGCCQQCSRRILFPSIYLYVGVGRKDSSAAVNKLSLTDFALNLNFIFCLYNFESVPVSFFEFTKCHVGLTFKAVVHRLRWISFLPQLND